MGKLSWIGGKTAAPLSEMCSLLDLLWSGKKLYRPQSLWSFLLHKNTVQIVTFDPDVHVYRSPPREADTLMLLVVLHFFKKIVVD